MNKIILGVVVVVVLVGGVMLFGNQTSDSMDLREEIDMNAIATTTGAAAVTASSTDNGVEIEAGVKEFTVAGNNFAFVPSTMRVKKGDTVRIVFKNTGGLHDWKIDEFNASTKKINSGEEDTIEFVADQTGSFEYYCSVGSHREMGMKGMLIVE